MQQVNEGSASERFEALTNLRQLWDLKAGEGDDVNALRRIVIQLSRCHRKLDNRLDEAIDVLSRFIDDWRDRATPGDASDVYYQRACYYCLLGQQSEQDAEVAADLRASQAVPECARGLSALTD